MGLATGVFIYALARVRARARRPPAHAARRAERAARAREPSAALGAHGERRAPACTGGAARAQEFGTNPKYTIMKGRRTSDHVKPTPAEGERFVGNRLIPHTKTAFNLFPFNFRPITDLKRFEGGNCE